LSIPLLGLIGLLAAFNTEAINDFIMIGDNNAFSVSARFEAYRIVYELAKINPLFGLGPANYYYYTSLIPILGWHVQFNSHMQYIDLIAQIGFIGLGCFFWFVWEIWKLGLKLQHQAPNGFPRAYVYGALGGLVGMLVAGILGDWLLPFVYNVGLGGFRSSVLGWLFLGGLVAIENFKSRKYDE
jgi:hypothetical protein